MSEGERKKYTDAELVSKYYCPKCGRKMTKFMHLPEVEGETPPPRCDFCNVYWTIQGGVRCGLAVRHDDMQKILKQQWEIIYQQNRVSAGI